ncbi:MAG: carboxypeptidase regulatory-like domain-containing protein [Acidobacteriaceae bacterium]|nr:carboxypeptidase regulatory-like domain-containing protein [Acidobacteriaceae bacterium]
MRYLLAFACACIVLGSQDGGTYTISGTVTAGTSNKALRHVLVMITPTGTAGHPTSCVTGDDGRFSFAGLPAGKYSLSAQRPNSYWEGFRQTGNYSTAIVTGPGLDSTNIPFALAGRGSISGTVQDEENEQVRGAQVFLFHRGVFSGRVEAQVESVKNTDSSGGFHFGELRPGAYLIAVTGQPWYTQPAARKSSDPEFDVSYPITYYGGSTDADASTPILVEEGSSQTVEITLHAERSAHVDITAANGESDGPGWNVYAVGPNGTDVPVSPRFVPGADGRQMIAIAPGRYIFERSGKGRTTVDVRGDLAASALGSLPKTSISGKLSFEGPAPGTSARVSFVGPRRSLEPTLAQDGTFTLDGAAAGQYQVQLFGAAGYYVKSVSVGESAIAGGEVEVKAGATIHVSIVAAKGTTNIDGVAMRDGAPFAGAMVLLIPEDLGKTLLIRRDQSDSDGTFTLPEVAPGRYTLVAINDGGDLEYEQASVIAPYLKGGRTMLTPVTGDSRIKVNVLERRR